MKTKAIFLFLLAIALQIFAQTPTQTIKGLVLDASSNKPIENAIFSINNTEIFTKTDISGNFNLKNIPVGTYTFKISAENYETYFISEAIINSAKETNLNIFLSEKIKTIDEVVIKQKINKQTPLNATASVGAKMLSMEEASRYAGGFDDPARLVSTFAGVSSNVGNNGISVHGNNPKYLQWKLEGIEIPNPNHFADTNTFGAGILSGLSSHNLGNSDFFSGAFPAEYSNVLSGIFDMNIRKGNTGKKERTFQAGFTGFDYAEEGPFKKGGNSSYIFNYRYSSLSLLKSLFPQDAGKGIKYQDLSFKLNFPTKKAGTFSLWGLGMKDFTGIDAKTNPNDWETIANKQTMNIDYKLGTLGLSHKILVNEKSYIKSIIATTSNNINIDVDLIDQNGNLNPDSNVKNSTTNIILSSYINTKFSPKNINKTGFTITNMRYHMLIDKNSLNIVNNNGNSFLMNVYSNTTYNISNNLNFNIGVSSQYFALNNKFTIEPRFGLKYYLSSEHILSFGYGLHSRLESLNYYFSKNPSYNNELINKNLDFTKSHHFAVDYDFNISQNAHFKTEVFYQNIYNVPVIKDSSFSILNNVNDWFVNGKLENTGKGRNYGIDVSLDKYITSGFYYNINASLFSTEYTGGDNIWRKTRFDRNYAINILGGKEWTFGKEKNRAFGTNFRLIYQGGDRYSPIDLGNSIIKQDVVFDENRAFSQQLSPSFVTHFTFLYRVNKKKSTQEIALKILNANRYKEFYDFRFNYKTQGVDEHRDAIIIPNLSYKIEF
ncbi:TonB-dependent receptor [Elizabethkingia miricola]|uniref:TonB-dependent receptor n=1 Tax=Elizabethkingia miricola TaxID=172045 RepID=UPI00293C58EF|nr:carboxypeptidase-like regulatory domain-containing protein [Elizabethkingia miricola]MDV3462925.1 prevent-host-death protein [Elizabethkingia anophelis]WQM38098.1 carboxypeptidase-like regulatory domain-containing protein [Elizabethkingia miricola]